MIKGSITVDQHRADLLTVGHYLAELAGKPEIDDEFFQKLGEAFEQFCRDQKLVTYSYVATHHLVKQTLMQHFVKNQLAVINFLLTTDLLHEFISKPISVSCYVAMCTVQVCREYNGEHKIYDPFYIEDFSRFSQTFLAIDELSSVQEGAGAFVLKKVLESVSVPVLLQAGYLYYGDYCKAVDEDDMLSGLQELVKYYEALGFRNVNDQIGRNCGSITMLYPADFPLADSNDGPKQIKL